MTVIARTSLFVVLPRCASSSADAAVEETTAAADGGEAAGGVSSPTAAGVTAVLSTGESSLSNERAALAVVVWDLRGERPSARLSSPVAMAACSPDAGLTGDASGSAAGPPLCSVTGMGFSPTRSAATGAPSGSGSGSGRWSGAAAAAAAGSAADISMAVAPGLSREGSTKGCNADRQATAVVTPAVTAGPGDGRRRVVTAAVGGRRAALRPSMMDLWIYLRIYGPTIRTRTCMDYCHPDVFVL